MPDPLFPKRCLPTGREIHLLAACGHLSGLVLAQLDVGEKTIWSTALMLEHLGGTAGTQQAGDAVIALLDQAREETDPAASQVC